jgi:hypothetical protein
MHGDTNEVEFESTNDKLNRFGVNTYSFAGESSDSSETIELDRRGEDFH